jgi:hypothetical protein
MFRAQLLHDRDNIPRFFFRHIRENGEAYETFPHFSSRGAVFRSPAERLLIIGVKMERSPMNRTAYPPRLEKLDEGISVNIEPVEAKLDREEVPGMNPICVNGWKLDFSHGSECFYISICDLFTVFSHLFCPGCLILQRGHASHC